MQQMRERAGKILNHLTVADVATDGGVELIKREMEKSPIIRLLEHKEVDRKRQKFMKLSRYPKESLESFINRASIYRHENDQCQNYKVGTKFYLGHLLDAAKLSRKDEALIKTASQGLHDEGRVVNAMLDLAEQLEGLPGFPIGKGEPDMPDEDKYLVQKRAGDREFPPRRDDRSGRFQHGGKGSRGNRLRAKWKQVFHTILEDIDSSDGQASEPAAEEDEPDQDDGTGGEEESASGETEAASDLPAEVYAQEYKAKKRVNEIKQMRQYYKKDPEKTKAWIKEQQKREPCFLCQKLGHWSQECPLRQKKGASNSRSSHAVHVTSVTSGPASSEPGQWDMLASLAAYTKSDPELPDDVQQCQGFHECLVTIDHTTLDHETFWSMRELHSSLILDLGCMKSVAGTKWVNQHIQRLRGLGRWMKAVKGHESFRFGDGHELCSEYAFVFEATVLGVRVILKVSVVPGECPPLLSKPACSQMGMIIDTELHTVSSRKLKIKNYGLHQTYGGHYALPIAEFTEAMQPIHAPDIPQHLEAIPVYVMQSDVQVPAPPDTDVMRSWTRHDKAMHTTVGPGTKGPPWHMVVRRVVYDARTGDHLLEEWVDEDTPMRRRLQCESDIISVFMYRTFGSGRSMSTNSMSVAPPTLPFESRDGLASETGEAGCHRRRCEPPGSGTGPTVPGGRRGLRECVERDLRVGPCGDAFGSSRGEASDQKIDIADLLCDPQPPTKESFQVGRQQGEVQRRRESSPAEGNCRQEPQADPIPGYPKDALHTGSELNGTTYASEAHDDCGAQGPGRGVGGAALAVHGPPLHRGRGLEGDKSILGGTCPSPRGGAQDSAGALADAGCSQSGCGQADLAWRTRLPADPHRRGRAEPRGPTATQGETSDTLRTARGKGEGRRQEPESQGVDRSPGQLPDPVQSILGRPGDQCGAEFDLPDADVQVETAGVDASDQASGRDGVRRQLAVEKEPALADDDDDGEADRLPVGPLGRSASAMQRSEAELLDEGECFAGAPGKKPSRGLIQKMKKGVSNAQRTMSLLTLVATIPMRWHVLEVFSTSAPWHRHAGEVPWKCSGPLWALSHPPSEKQCQKMMAQVQEEKPDLVILRPMCGPWSPWTQDKGKTLKAKRQKYVPLWEFVEALWRYQRENKRLILLVVPAKMLCPGRDELRLLGATGYLLPDVPQDPTVPLGHDPEDCLQILGGGDRWDYIRDSLDLRPDEPQDPTVPRGHDPEDCLVPVGGA